MKSRRKILKVEIVTREGAVLKYTCDTRTASPEAIEYFEANAKEAGSVLLRRIIKDKPSFPGMVQ